jgi:hypothetical protein
MSGEYLARLKAQRPDVDWDAEMAAARARRERAGRSPWQRFRHWAHAQAHPDLHREKCSKCRERLTP